VNTIPGQPTIKKLPLTKQKRSLLQLLSELSTTSL